MVIQVTLPPLEFTDCLQDSPEFRENLHRHEKELDKTSHQIKRIIKEVKELIAAAASEYIVQEGSALKGVLLHSTHMRMWLLEIIEMMMTMMMIAAAACD